MEPQHSVYQEPGRQISTMVVKLHKTGNFCLYLMTLTPGHFFRQSHDISQINNQSTTKIHVVSAKRRKNPRVQVKIVLPFSALCLPFHLITSKWAPQNMTKVHVASVKGGKISSFMWNVGLVSEAFWSVQRDIFANHNDNSREELFLVTSFSRKVDNPQTLSLLSILNRKQREISKLIYS